MKKGIVSNRRMLLSLIALLWFAKPASAQQTARSTAGTSVTNCGGFYEYLPPTYAASTANFPLIIFIHGVGELGNGTTQLPNVCANGIPKLIKAGTFPAAFTSGGKSYSFIVLTPQFKVWPSPVDVLSLLNYAKTKYRIDPSRIYITGLSMGGGVTWNFGSANDTYAAIAAAIVPVSGAMDPTQTPNAPITLAKDNVPVWAFHNTGDPTVPVAYSQNWLSMINAYKPASNPTPKLTLFNANQHDAWTKAYDPTYKENGMNVYEWMLQYQKGVTPTKPTVPVDTPVTPAKPPVTTPTPPATTPVASTGGRRIVAKVNNKNGMYYTDAMTSFGLKPGDTLCIPAGDYEYIQLMKIVGTKEKPIVITNCGGQVRVGINTHQSDIAFSLQSCSFIEISGSGTPGLEYGFDINGKNLDGVEMQGMYFGAGTTDFDVHNMYIHDVNIMIVAKTTQFCDNPQYWEGTYVMNNPKIHHIKGRDSQYEGFYIGNTHYIITYADCGDIKSHHIQNLQVYDNDIENTGYDGIQIAMADLGTNLIHDNIVKNYGTVKLDAQSYGMIMGGGSRVRLYNNTIDKGYLPGIALFGSGVSYCYNNTVSNVSNGEGIQVADKLAIDPVTAYIFNNTIYNTGADGIKVYAYLTTVGHQVYNNLIINAGSGGDYPSPGMYIRGAQNIKFTYGNNLLYKTFAAAGMPNGASGDFHLAAGSGAIDAGVDEKANGVTSDKEGTARPYNGKFDVGAYEYHGATTANKAPVADAGTNSSITLPTSTASLNGTASKDADGSIVKYAWTQVNGPATAKISTPATATTSVTGLTVKGNYVFNLVVTDNDSATATDQVTITVNAAAVAPPVSVAGKSIVVQLPTSTTTLDGSASNSPGGSALASYLWAQISGPSTAGITSSATAKTPVKGLVKGVYTFRLTVKDASGQSASDTMTVTVNAAPNVAPVANAGTTITLLLPTSGTSLNGKGSSDPDGTIVTYLWEKISGPSTPKFDKTNTAVINVSALVQGVYVFRLTVTDDDGARSSAQVTVIVNLNVVAKVTVSAGGDQTITLPTSVATLSGTATSTKTITKYAWIKISGPSTPVFANAAAASTQVSGLVAGTYVLELSATNTDNQSASDQMTLTVNQKPNTLPVSVPGKQQTIVLPTNSVTLNGFSSYDPDGTINSYDWNKVSGPAGAVIQDDNSGSTAITGLVQGTYVYSLTVTDNRGGQNTANVTVVVQPEPNGGSNSNMPVAIAGPDVTITSPVAQATLNGSASYENGGSLVSYRWEKLTGPDMAFTNATAATTTVTKLVPASYLFRLTVTDAKGATSWDTTTVLVNESHNDTNSTNVTVSMYPNPVASNLTVSIKTVVQRVYMFVYDLSGKQLLYKTLAVSGTVNQTVNMASLPAGAYFVVLRSPDFSSFNWSGKVVKQ